MIVVANYMDIQKEITKARKNPRISNALTIFEHANRVYE
jgi:hypothetical protein